MIARFLCALALFPLVHGAQPVFAGDEAKKNVLFISVDDLTPQLGCYGDASAKTPNIDRLAARGMIFRRAYCQESVCSPSRSSVLTGRRPDATGVHDLVTHFRKALPDVVTLPQHFKENGYQTAAVGKVFHPAFNMSGEVNLEDPVSWTKPWWGAQPQEYFTPEGMAIARKWFDSNRKKFRAPDWKQAVARGTAWESPSVPDAQLADGQIAVNAIRSLGELKDQPFFLAVGFVRPHLPFVAPKKYFDMHPLESVKLPARPPAEGVPAVAPPHYSELSAYHGMPKSEADITDEQARELVRAYRACVSYVDAQIGLVLAELDRLGLKDSTIVVIWSDHGYHLGHNGFWSKGTNFEQSVRVPLIVAGQGLKVGACDAIVELVDLYPTLCDLATLPTPEGLEGSTFEPHLVDNLFLTWKSAAFSQTLRKVPAKGKKTANVTGYSIRTDRYRYTEWGPRVTELYDHKTDPGETKNLAGLPEMAAKVAELRQQLKAGWTAAKPR